MYAPYQYAANDPAKNIDVNGDSLFVDVTTYSVDAQGNRTSTTNKLYYGYNDCTGYGFFNSDGTLYAGGDAGVGQVADALKNLTEGAVGKALVDQLATDDKNNTSIVNSTAPNGTDPSGTSVNWNPAGTTSAPDQNGSTTRPSYIGLGHELAHVQDIRNGTINKGIWTVVVDANNQPVSILNAEIYATHVENELRAEHKLSLRVSYVNDGGQPYEPTRIIKSGTNSSVYYDKSGNTNYQPLTKKQLPFNY